MGLGLKVTADFNIGNKPIRADYNRDRVTQITFQTDGLSGSIKMYFNTIASSFTIIGEGIVC
jgi:hypothetical protein